MIKPLILMSIFGLNFLQHAKSQNKNLVEREGLIIANTWQAIPQDVILIETKAAGQDLRTLIHSCLGNDTIEAKWVYFQVMRHIMPDMANVLDSVPCLPATTTALSLLLGKDIKIFKGKIIFDTTLAENLYIPDPDKKYAFDITIDNKTYNITVVNSPKLWGVPFIFEKID